MKEYDPLNYYKGITKNKDCSNVALFLFYKMGHISNIFRFLKLSDHTIDKVYIQSNYYEDSDPNLQETLDRIEQNYDCEVFDHADQESWNTFVGSVYGYISQNVDYVVTNRTPNFVYSLCEEWGFPRDNVLVYEIGWLPWEKTHHFLQGGVCAESQLAGKSEACFMNHEIYTDEINYIISELKSNGETTFSDEFKQYQPFVYVPLQTLGEFKRNAYSDFRDSNEQFVQFIDKIVPREYNLLVKDHPATPESERLDLTKYSDRLIDISDRGYSIYDCIIESEFVITINSTSVIESILLGKKCFTYGDDVYCNKNLTYHRIYDAEKFRGLIYRDIPNLQNGNNLRFVSYLMDRSIRRDKDHLSHYIKNHYWNKKLFETRLKDV